MDPSELDALLDRLVAEYADRVASGRAGELDDLLAHAPIERRVELRRLLELIDAGGLPANAAPRPLGPGVELGGCRILGELGRGGVATVYRAEQKALKREVALKVLRPGLALDPRHAERFRREGHAIARLDHPNVVRVHDVGAEAGHLFLVMEKIEGGNLAEAIRRLPPADRRDGADFRRAVGIAEADAVADGGGTIDGGSAGSFEVEVARFFAVVARAVAAAHAHGVVHRDLKPSNILLKRGGAPVVADFGLAKGEGDLGNTLTGEPLGTPYYMSPEQVEHAQARVDARTDVWSLGVTLYEVLAGRRPFEGPTTIAVFDAIRREPPKRLRDLNPRLSRDVEAVVSKALAHDPADRYASAEALAADLDSIALGGRVRAPRWSARRHGRWHLTVGAGYYGRPIEWRSKAELFGLPLVHVNLSGARGFGRMRIAKGIVAIGDLAVGVVALGTVAIGVLGIGALGMGVVGFGGLALALLAVAGVAAGGIAIGGVAAGIFAFGGFAAGWWALGGVGRSWLSHAEMAEIYQQWLRGALGFASEAAQRVLDRVLLR
jgi:tRNA A-37 threonylcarbamoyl transferase component Bud32